MRRIRLSVISDINKTAAFSGYRPQKLPFGNDLSSPVAVRLRNTLRAEYTRLIRAGYRRFLTGGALGSDLMAAEVILELKYRLMNDMRIEHILCLPCVHHSKNWDMDQRNRLREIADKSNGCYYISDCEYYKGCMQVRNRYMVDNSSLLVAVYDGQSGGTENTMAYAEKQGKKVLVVEPSLAVNIEFANKPEDIEKLLAIKYPLNENKDIDDDDDGEADNSSDGNDDGETYYDKMR